MKLKNTLLVVKNMEQSKAFYRDLFGLEVIADFEEIDDNKLHLNVSGEEAILYPFFKFLEVPEELKILENLDLSKTTICGAFKDF